MQVRLFLLVALAFPVGCGDSSDPIIDAGDSSDSAVQSDTAADSNPNDDAAVDSGTVDSGLGDAGPGDAGPDDAGAADAPEVDGGPDAGPGNYVAVAGARCSPQTRIGVVSLRDSGASRYLFGSLSDSPRPELGDPAQTTDACVFHEANNAACDCSGDLVCTHDRERCVTPPARVDIGVVIHAGAESFTATPVDEGSGPMVSESVSLSGDTFGMTVTGLGATIFVEPMMIPARIEVEAELTGSYDAPEAMDLTWPAEDTDISIYSLTNINHHVREPTFTECVASASDGALNIPGSMLVPLSVSTGLEFQRVDSMRFAAAELPEGCVEFRFLTQ